MFNQVSDKRVAAFFADGLEECEGLIVLDLLYRAGIAADIVSVTQTKEVVSSHNVRIGCDMSIYDADFSFDAYDMLFLPGGMPGTLNLKASERLCSALVEHVHAAKDVAAICAAPSILAELGLLKGRCATANPGFQDVLVEHGATLLQTPVVTDANILTSKGMGTSIDLGLAIIERYLGTEAVCDMKERIVLD